MISSIGKVYLVGAGPGDPKLLTLKGKEILERADVILHDALSNPQVLEWVSSAAEKVYVGKRGGEESVSQDEINKLMKDYAFQRKIVVRLKGGDPMIFGRGAEEAEFLVANGIPFEIVPGVTSAIAAPTYAGIPLTHRNLSSSVAFITGRRKTNDLPIQIPPYRTVDTLVILMGVANLPLIRDALIQAGWPTDTKVAIIAQGTTPQQETVYGTVSNINARLSDSSPEGPSIIVVGAVVGCHNYLQWFEKKPLLGTKVLITRAKKQAGNFRLLLEEQGASVVEFPTIEIIPVADTNEKEKLDAAIRQVENFDLIIFTSSNGVELFFEKIQKIHGGKPSFRNTRFAAIGPATAEAIRIFGVPIEIVPPEIFQQEGLLAELQKWDLRGKRILLPRARGAREFLAKRLRELGSDVTEISIYSVRIPQQNGHDPRQDPPEADVITFTSSSTVHHFFSLLGDQALHYLQGLQIASIGEITTGTLMEYGLLPHIRSKESTTTGLVRAIVESRRP